jgi:hypothetical protein
MSVTLAVFQLARFWLKAVAPLNMPFIFATDATFQLPMSELNVGLKANNEPMLVTAAVFQSAMLPYVVAAVVGFVAHAVAAVPMLPSTRHMREQLAPHMLLHVGYAVRSVVPHAK